MIQSQSKVAVGVPSELNLSVIKQVEEKISFKSNVGRKGSASRGRLLLKNGSPGREIRRSDIPDAGSTSTIRSACLEG